MNQYGSVRRLLALPGYENISIELPIETPGHDGIVTAILKANMTLLEWGNVVLSGKSLNQGKSVLEALQYEIAVLSQQLTKSTNS